MFQENTASCMLSTSSGSYNLSSPFPSKILELWEKVSDVYIPFEAEYSIVFYFLYVHWAVESLCVNWQLAAP